MTAGQPCARHPELSVIAACDRCGDFGCARCLPTGRSCLRCVPNPAVPKPDYGKSYALLFQDPRWVWKVATGGLLMFFSFLFLVPFFIVFGYHDRIARREREGPQVGLPEFDGVLSLAWAGFKSYFALFLPLLGLYGALLVFIGLLAFLNMPAAGTKPPAQPPPAFFIGMFGGMFAFYGGVFLHALLIPAIQIQYLRTGSVLSSLHVGALWRIIRGHPVDYFIFVLVGIALYFLAAIAGELMCLVGLFFTMPMGLYLQGHLLGRYCAWLDAVEGAG